MLILKKIKCRLFPNKHGHPSPEEYEQEELDIYLNTISSIKWLQPTRTLEEIHSSVSVFVKKVGLEKEVNEIKCLPIYKADKLKDDEHLDLSGFDRWGLMQDALFDSTFWDEEEECECGRSWYYTRGKIRKFIVNTVFDKVFNKAKNSEWVSSRDLLLQEPSNSFHEMWLKSKYGRNIAWQTACNITQIACLAGEDLLAMQTKKYQKKFPKGTFLNLIPLLDMGLYPVGIIDGAFRVYVPQSRIDFPFHP